MSPPLSAVERESWAAWTRIPLKAECYERETYYREGLADASEVLGSEASSVLHKSALVLIKRDGLACGKVSVILDFVRRNGYAVTGFERLLITRLHWREMWRYQLTSATVDRLAVNDLVLPGPALLLLLTHKSKLTLPATVWLSGLKGPSDVGRQPPDCLRRTLGQPNRIISFVHVADEPADILRELALLVGSPERRRTLLKSLHDGPQSAADDDALAAIAAESDESRIALDANDSIRRVEDAVRRESDGAGRARRRVIEDLDRMKRREIIDWRVFASAFDASHAHADSWDIAMLGASFIAYDEPGKPKMITAVDSALWTAPPG